MLIILHLVLLGLFSFLLVQASIRIINSLTTLSRFLALREFSIAFILMALATSLPEIFVGITSALENTPVLSLGNVLGSNIANLTLVTGIVVLSCRRLFARSIIVRRDALYMAVYSSVPLLLLLDSNLSRIDGVILILFYFFYLGKLLQQRSSFKERHNHIARKEASRSLIIFTIAVLVLLASAEGIVYSAEKIAVDLGIPVSLVGLFFVSLGTSLPEIVFELKAVENKHSGLVLGDLVGSVVTNSTLVLGITALIRPIHIQSLDIFLTPIIYLIVVLAAFEIFVRTDKKLVTWEGLFLIITYILFLLTELGLEILHNNPTAYP